MSCPANHIQACDFAQYLVSQTPVFDELIMEDITLTDGWIGNVSLFEVPFGTPPEITQDRFRTVVPNVTKPWGRVTAGSCLGNPCDPPQHQIGWGSDRLTYFEEQQAWDTPLLCFDQMMNVTHAKEQLDNIITKTLKPATNYVASNFLRRRTLYWSKYKQVANGNFGVPGTDGVFTYNWTLDANGDEVYLDMSVPPTRVFKLVPQMLQNEFGPLMREGYGGENPFKDTSPYIELVSDSDTMWELNHLGGATGVGGTPSIASNWRFEQWAASHKYWAYGFSGQIGDYLFRNDEMGLRFNFLTDLGAGVTNRYRYQVVQPYTNQVTTGAGGSAGIGRVPNRDYDKAQYVFSFISHKKGLELGVPSMANINPITPFKHRSLAGKWEFHMDNLGADENGVAINNEWGNKGKFAAWFKYYVRPLHTEFLEAIFHKREQKCTPEINTCHADPGYPHQYYTSTLPPCPVPDAFTALYGTGVPTGTQDGPVPTPVPDSTGPDV